MQLHHILLDVLQQVGEADVFISSFTVAEEFIRKLYKLKQENKIRSLNLLIDLRSAKKTLHLSNFLMNVCDDVFLANNHSKIILVKSANYFVSIVTSQNQTRGNRFEAGMICTDKAVYDFYQNEFKKQIPNFLNIGNIFRRNT